MKTVGVISLAGCIKADELDVAKKNLESYNYNVVFADHILEKKRYLAGDDVIKVKDLQQFILDKNVDIIMSSRGGYGSLRLINQIDFELIKKYPKIYCGYSDITALLLMIYKRTGLITYHGPMLISDFYEPSIYTVENFQKAISNQSLCIVGNKIYREGIAEGVIWGGNLSTVVSLCGLDFIPNKDFIFFVEDLNESVYKIDKMFQQLFNLREFKEHCKAIILGDFLDVDNIAWLEELFLELSNNNDIPVVGGFNITHSKNKLTIPIGKQAYLQGKNVIIK